MERLERFDYFKKTVMEENNFLKKLVRWSYLILVLSLIGAIFYFKREARNFKDMAQVKAVELSTIKDSVRVLQQKNGDLSFKFNAVEVEKRNLREALEISGYEIKDLKEKEIKYRKLIAVLELEIQGYGEGQSDVKDTIEIIKTETKTDTIYVQLIRDWSDSRLNLFDMRIQNGKFNFGYTYNIEDMDLFVEDRKDSYVVTATFNQPGLNVISGNSIVIQNKKGFFEKPVIWGVAGFLGGYLITK